MNIKFKNSTEKMAVIAVCTAVIIVVSQLSIPMPSGVPITMQTFGIALCGYILGAKYASISTAIYIALGAVGLPVFSNFSGGFGSLLGYTGGFIWGFVLMAFLCGLGNKWNNKIVGVALGIAGLLLCDICGAFQYAVIAKIDFVASFMLVAVPYLVKDIICVVLAFVVARLIVTALKKSKLVTTV